MEEAVIVLTDEQHNNGRREVVCHGRALGRKGWHPWNDSERKSVWIMTKNKVWYYDHPDVAEWGVQHCDLARASKTTRLC